MHSLVAPCCGFDGANGLRPAHVWFGRSFDKAVTSRRAPGGAGILTSEELAGVFHLGLVLANQHLGYRPHPSGRHASATHSVARSHSRRNTMLPSFYRPPVT